MSNNDDPNVEIMEYLNGLEKHLNRCLTRTLSAPAGPIDELLYIAEMLWNLDIITIGKYHEIQKKYGQYRSLAFSEYKN